MHYRTLAFNVVATMLLSGASAQTSLTGLGFLPGGESSSATAASADGRIVVGWSGSSAGPSAFRWGAISGMRELPRLAGATASYAHDISDDGTRACGWCIVNRQRQAVLWTDDQPPQPLGLLSGGTWSQALAISADGQTVVGQADAADGQHAVVWTAAGGLRALPDPQGHRAYSAVSIRGSYIVGLCELAGTTGVRWTNLEQPQLLETPDNGISTLVFDVDATGRSFGGGVTEATPELPVRWTGTSDTTFALPNGFVNGYYLASSNNGSLVAGTAYGTWIFNGFLSGQAVGGTVLINTYLQQVQLPQPQWGFDSPTGISADGKVVVGAAWHNDRREAWVLRLPGAVPACAADIGLAGGSAGADGHLDNNDFIAFINLFFVADARADMGVAGGFAGHDGRYDNNDFIAFIDAFFMGCP